MKWGNYSQKLQKGNEVNIGITIPIRGNCGDDDEYVVCDEVLLLSLLLLLHNEGVI
jgi:hypothetical protein